MFPLLNPITPSMFSPPLGGSPSLGSTLKPISILPEINFEQFKPIKIDYSSPIPSSLSGSPSLESTLKPKYDLNQIDFSKFLPSSPISSPSLESTLKPTSLFKPIKVDYSSLIPSSLSGSPSLESTLKPPSLLPQFKVDTDTEFKVPDFLNQKPEPSYDLINQGKHKDWTGNTWSKSFNPDGLYMKNLNEKEQLHVHTNKYGLITGAKIKEIGTGETLRLLSNSDAAMEDLNPAKPFWDKKKGKFQW
jgi:hypothetical protein